MLDELIHKAAKLMREQAEAYRQLDATCARLAVALVSWSPSEIEALSRAGESEMLRMRSRLVQIVGALSSFSEARAAAPQNSSVSEEARREFESASNDLTSAARQFQRTQERANALAMSGSSFAAACIEMCGVPPTTYSAPGARRGDVRAWA